MSNTQPTLRQWLDTSVSAMAAAGIEQAEADAIWLACHVLGRQRGEVEVLRATSTEPLASDALTVMDELLARRLEREPLWHILGRAPFLGMELEVGPGVFSPRPETELLAHQAITEILAIDSPTGDLLVCDVGAGSGAIGLAIAQAVSNAQVISVEPSDEARVFLAKNVHRFGDGRVQIVSASAAEASDHVAPGSLDAVVSNPPYLIRDEDWVDLETGNFDPDQALYADNRGMAVMADVVEFAAGALRPGGVTLVEHGTTHNEAVAEILTSHGFSLISHQNDLVGRPRLTRATLPSG